MKEPPIFLEHVLTCIQSIEQFKEGLSKKDFINNDLKQSAILRKIEIIGEAMKNIPSAFQKEYPEIEWKKIMGTRDKLIHQYFGVDLNVMWDVIQNNIPILKNQLQAILKRLK